MSLALTTTHENSYFRRSIINDAVGLIGYQMEVKWTGCLGMYLPSIRV
jgi:hypothetical protein